MLGGGRAAAHAVGRAAECVAASLQRGARNSADARSIDSSLYVATVCVIVAAAESVHQCVICVLYEYVGV